MLFLCCDKSEAKNVKSQLESKKVLLKKEKVLTKSGFIWFPINTTNIEVCDKNGIDLKVSMIQDIEEFCPPFNILKQDAHVTSVEHEKSLEKEAKTWLENNTHYENEKFEKILKLLPNKTETYYNLALISKSNFENQDLLAQFEDSTILKLFIKEVFCSYYQVNNIAFKDKISKGNIRKPILNFICQEDENPVTFKIENRIAYFWYPKHTMFCKGNITEKLRIVNSKEAYSYNFTETNKITILDLYCGIGYFVFPYFKRFSNSKIIAIDMNPSSIECLLMSATLHGINYSFLNKNNINLINISNLCEKFKKIQELRNGISKLNGSLLVGLGNNLDFVESFKNSAQHVNLGLIPDSKQGYDIAIMGLCPITGGILHIHHNIENKLVNEFKNYLIMTLESKFLKLKEGNWKIKCLSCFRVKSYAPNVEHYVFDILCLPS